MNVTQSYLLPSSLDFKYKTKHRVLLWHGLYLIFLKKITSSTQILALDNVTAFDVNYRGYFQLRDLECVNLR